LYFFVLFCRTNNSIGGTVSNRATAPHIATKNLSAKTIAGATINVIGEILYK
jgi:hypothetical protein